MGFMKNIAQAGLSMIPGVGGIASAALGALGNSGKQSQQSTTNQSQHTNEEFNNSSNVNMLDKAIEDPTFAGARTGLLGLYGQELRKANQPIYGDAQKAQHLNNLNDLADASIQSLKGALGAAGANFSGQSLEGLSGIERQRYGQAADFMGQLPFMEDQARQARMQPLLGMGMNWLGRAPISTQRTGSTTENGTRKADSTGTSQTNGFMQGPGFMNQFAGNLGGYGAYQGMRNGGGFGNILDDWRKWRKPTATPTPAPTSDGYDSGGYF